MGKSKIITIDLAQSALNSRRRFARMFEHIRAILDTIREPFVVLDGALRIRLVNKSFCKAFRVSPKAINGQYIHRLGKGAWTSSAFKTWLSAIPIKRTDIDDFEMEGFFKGLGQRTVIFNARHVLIPGSTKKIILLTLDDVTLRKQAEAAMGKLNAALKNDSMTDMLTGLYNRRGYTALSQHYLNLAHRRGKRVFVIYADLDGLKLINDETGHPGGNQALIRTAGILRQTFRKSDIIARIGGDEFAVVTIENGHDSVAIQMARLQSSLKRHAIQNHYRHPISLSIGVARSNRRKTRTIAQLTAQADARMYVEKRDKHAREDDLKPISISSSPA